MGTAAARREAPEGGRRRREGADCYRAAEAPRGLWKEPISRASADREALAAHRHAVFGDPSAAVEDCRPQRPQAQRWHFKDRRGCRTRHSTQRDRSWNASAMGEAIFEAKAN